MEADVAVTLRRYSAEQTCYLKLTLRVTFDNDTAYRSIHSAMNVSYDEINCILHTSPSYTLSLRFTIPYLVLTILWGQE